MSAKRSASPEATVARARTTEEKRRRRKDAAIGNPVLFGEVYLRPFDPKWKNAGPLPRLAGEVLAFTATTRRGVIYSAPETLKTTAFSQVYPLWLTFRFAALGRVLAGMLLSEEQGLAAKNLGVVAWHIEFNPLLRRDFLDSNRSPLVVPDPDEDKWTDTEIIVSREGKIKDPTWAAKGLDSAGIQGSRLDVMLGDDVITPRSAGSPARQEDALELWDTSITTRVLDEGQAIAAGNYHNPRDLLSKLEARDEYRVLRRPTLHVKGDRSKAPDDHRDKTAVLQIPEKWPRKRIDREFREKPNRARRIHLLDSKAETGERLRWEWVDVIPSDATPVQSCVFFLAADPAPGGDSDDLDFFNLSVGALHQDEKGGAMLDLIASHDARIDTTAQAKLLGSYYDRFNRIGHGVRAIGGAKVSLDRYFRGSITIARPDLEAKLCELSVPGSKAERLEGLGPVADSGYLRVWDSVTRAYTSAPEDQAQELSFYEQWVGFAPAGTSTGLAHDDKLDGADLLVRTARKYGYRGGVKKIAI